MTQIKNLVRAKAKSLRKNKSGSVAVEFSIIAIPFFALIFASFEVGWYYFVNATVDAATLEASRKVRTGAPQQNGFDKDAFYDEVCPKLELFGECRDVMTVEISKFEDFEILANDTSDPICADSDPGALDNISYDPGADNEIIRVRICLIYKTMNFKLGANLAQTDDGRRKLTSSYVFRNEPFSRNERAGS